MPARKDPRKTLSQRPTIGVIIDSMTSGYQAALWRELQTAAAQHDTNLLGFVGRALDSQPSPQHQANVIYKLANENTLDGVVLLPGIFSQQASPDYRHAFLQGFHPLPVVSVAMDLEQTPSVLLDNRKAIRDLMEHLIETHHCRRIAFIRMAAEHTEDEARFQAYKDALKEYNLPFDPDLVVGGAFDELAETAVELLYDQRKVTPDAMLASDDNVALALIEALRARGIAVPGDVIVTGFGDTEAARYAALPLTTIRQPLREQACRAIEIILNTLERHTVPLHTTLTPELVVRESCGCYQESLVKAAAPVTHLKPEAERITECRDEILAHMAADSGIEDLASLGAFLDAFSDALENNQAVKFLGDFSRILQQSSPRGEGISRWQSAVSALRQRVLAFLKGKPELEIAENLIQQSRVLISEIAQRLQARRILQIRQQQFDFHRLGQGINLATGHQALFEILTQGLPPLGISEFTISLYDGQNPEAATLSLVAARTQNGAAQLPPEGLPYPSDLILPEGFLPANRRFARIVQPLYALSEQFGFATFEAQAADETLYDALAEQISSGLQNIALIEQLERRSLRRQTASDVARAASSILDPEELMRTIVNLIRDRFDLYYAGLFLADRERKWAVLRAGTGEPGKRMLAENWRLEIGGSSMIGRCVATGKADIQLDVEKAPVHLRNPHLPDTRSELALPLISRGEILGALTIQSTSANAFSPEDIAVLQTMADQIAVALAHARLFEQTQDALLETETLLNVSQLASSALGMELALPQILDLVLKATPMDAGLFSVVNLETGKLELSAAHLPDSFRETLQTRGFAGSLCELVYTRREPIVVRDLQFESPIDAAGLLELGYRAYQGVPLESKGEILGTLCMFSKQTITPEDTSINLLRAVGQQVGFALENIRLFQQTQKTLAELEAAQRRYQIQAWSIYNRRRRIGGYRKTSEGLEPLGRRPLPEVKNVFEKHAPVITEESLTVPLMLRDQPIGAISLQRSNVERSWMPEEVALVESIGEQFALAAESLRLLDETQRQAARERLVAEITTKLRASNDPQAILQTVTQELRAALNAKRAQVLVQPANPGDEPQAAPEDSGSRGEA